MADLKESKLDKYYRAVAESFPTKIRDALQKIQNPSHELLALRRYIRKAKDLDRQWVWSAEQIKVYDSSPLAAIVRGEIEKVRKKFEELNQGYTLATSPIRDLARQVRLWNGNRTVRAASNDLKAKCLEEIIKPTYPNAPDPDSIERFRKFLGHCKVHPEPTSAAPGLSDHGQMNAIDFVVMRDREKIAGTETATLELKWVKPGWDRKLKEAVTDSKSLFIGPLQHPREPWHYTLPH